MDMGIGEGLGTIGIAEARAESAGVAWHVSLWASRVTSEQKVLFTVAYLINISTPKRAPFVCPKHMQSSRRNPTYLFHPFALHIVQYVVVRTSYGFNI